MYDPQQRQHSGRKLSDPKNLSPTFPDQQLVNVSFGAHEINITASELWCGLSAFLPQLGEGAAVKTIQ